MDLVKIQRFSPHDGPGVRTVVFTKGCPLRCAWCHNPETQSSKRQMMFQKNLCIGCKACAAVCPHQAHSFDPDGSHAFDASRCTACGRCAEVCVTNAMETVGTEKSVEEILSLVLRDSAFFGKDGGITLSGGEPMMQPEESIELLRLAKKAGISTAIETCGFFEEKYIPALCEVTDVFLWDFKDGVGWRHKQYSGVDNRKILDNLLQTDRLARHIVLRCIIVKGVNDGLDHLEKIAEVYHKLDHCEKVELLPYHAYAGGKAEQLGGKDNGNTAWIPTKEDLERIRSFLLRADVTL